MPQKPNRTVNQCRCRECLKQLKGETAKLHGSINHLMGTLDEKHRRQLAGVLASQCGHGGIKYVAVVTGLNRNTISRGKEEIE